MAAEGKAAIDPQGAVSFVVSFNESQSKQRRLPKGLAARRKQRQGKASFTEESIAEKQKRAEERREVGSYTYTLTPNAVSDSSYNISYSCPSYNA